MMNKLFITNSVYSFISGLLRMRWAIFELAKRDFQRQYMGSYLGFVWMFLQPLVYIYVLYIIFSLGFKSGIAYEMPFAIYLVTGMVCWLYFAENLSSSSDLIKGYAFLVKKVDFRLSVLPIVKLMSSFLPHLFLVSVAIGIAWEQGYKPSVYTLQVSYYFMCMSFLLIGFSLITASTNLFVKDISRLVTIIVQFGFWLTPIFWNISMIPEKYQWIVKLNPAYYVVTGYRDSIIGRIPFWEKAEESSYFWIFTLIVLIAGLTIYRKLKPHFAEVV